MNVMNRIKGNQNGYYYGTEQISAKYNLKMVLQIKTIERRRH